MSGYDDPSAQDADPQTAPCGDLVLFVHGTFAYDEEDTASMKNSLRWWQRDSEFADALKDCAAGLEVVTAAQRQSHPGGGSGDEA